MTIGPAPCRLANARPGPYRADIITRDLDAGFDASGDPRMDRTSELRHLVQRRMAVPSVRDRGEGPIRAPTSPESLRYQYAQTRIAVDASWTPRR
jgi:hypothetical protein